MHIEHEEDDVGLVDDFVQHVDVVSLLLFLCLVGSCDVESDGADMPQCDAEKRGTF